MDSSKSPSSIIKEAKRLIKLNDLTAAKVLLQPLLTEINDDYRVFSLLGYIYHKEGRFTRAVRNYEKSLELNPHDIETLINLSLIYNDLGKYEEGSRLYKNAVSMIEYEKNKHTSNDNSDQVHTMFASQHKSLGDLYLRYNRAEDALKEFEKVFKLTPWDYSINISIAECLSRLGDRRAAISRLKSLKQKNPELLDARLKLGHLLYLDGEIGQAIEEWDSVLKQDSGNIDAKMYLRMAQEDNIIP